jgi:hypothetical protein
MTPFTSLNVYSHIFKSCTVYLSEISGNFSLDKYLTFWLLYLIVTHTKLQKLYRLCIKRIVFLDFIPRLVSQEQTKLKKLKIIDQRLKPK